MSARGTRLKSNVIGFLSGSLLRRRLLSGGTWGFVGKVGGSIIGVVTNGLLARMLTPQEFGAYFLGLSILGALGVSLAYLLVVGDLVGGRVFYSPALVAITGLIAGLIAVSVVQE